MIADTVLLRGWAAAHDAGAVVRELLGPAEQVRSAAAARGSWQVGERLGPDHPVSRPESLTVLWAATPDAVDVLLGSQGCERPPDRDGVGVVRVPVTPEEQVVLDGRCWYRPVGLGIRATLWRRAG